MPGDESCIAGVHVQTWQAAYRGQVPDEFLDALSVDRRTESWRRIIVESALPTKGAFVLERDGRVVGFAHVAPSRDDDAQREVGELTAIYLLPEFWGLGAGRLLIERALRSLRSAGFAEATLWVLETNVRARRFYEAGNWYPDGARKLEDRDSFCMAELRYLRTTFR